MRQNLIRRLEALETHQFGSPRIASHIRTLMLGDTTKKQKFAKSLRGLERQIKDMTDFELKCLISFGDRLLPDEAREELEKANEGQPLTPGTWDYIRLQSLDRFVQSGASVLASPLYWSWFNPYTNKMIGR
jgi:hypothetical protein